VSDASLLTRIVSQNYRPQVSGYITQLGANMFLRQGEHHKQQGFRGWCLVLGLHGARSLVELTEQLFHCGPMKKSIYGHSKVEVSLQKLCRLIPGRYNAICRVNVREWSVAKSKDR